MEKGYVSSQMLCSTFASSYLSKHGETIFLNHILMLGFNILTSDLNKLFEKVIRGYQRGEVNPNSERTALAHVYLCASLLE